MYGLTTGLFQGISISRLVTVKFIQLLIIHNDSGEDYDIISGFKVECSTTQWFCAGGKWERMLVVRQRYCWTSNRNDRKIWNMRQPFCFLIVAFGVAGVICNPLRGDGKDSNGTDTVGQNDVEKNTTTENNGKYKTVGTSTMSIEADTAKASGVTPHAGHGNNLPLPIMIASPAVAVAIVIFICVTYKWHAMQLDQQAKNLALRVAAGACAPPSTWLPCSPCRPSQRLLTPNSPSSDFEFPRSPSCSSTRKKSMRTPTPPLLLTPPPHVLGGKRGSRSSNWSAISDQEVVNSSPRRHSTFLL